MKTTPPVGVLFFPPLQIKHAEKQTPLGRSVWCDECRVILSLVCFSCGVSLVKRDTTSEAVVSLRTVVTFVTWLISRIEFLVRKMFFNTISESVLSKTKREPHPEAAVSLRKMVTFVT